MWSLDNVLSAVTVLLSVGLHVEACRAGGRSGSLIGTSLGLGIE